MCGCVCVCFFFGGGVAEQVAIPRGELWTDPRFRPDGTSLYYSLTDAPAGMLPAVSVRWLRPAQFCPGPRPKRFSDGSLGVKVLATPSGHKSAKARRE